MKGGQYTASISGLLIKQRGNGKSRPARRSRPDNASRELVSKVKTKSLVGEQMPSENLV